MVYLASADAFVFPADGPGIPADDFETIGDAFAYRGLAPCYFIFARMKKVGGAPSGVMVATALPRYHNYDKIHSIKTMKRDANDCDSNRRHRH